MSDKLLGSESYKSDDDKDTFNFPSELDLSANRGGALGGSFKRAKTAAYASSASVARQHLDPADNAFSNQIEAQIQKL